MVLDPSPPPLIARVNRVGCGTNDMDVARMRQYVCTVEVAKTSQCHQRDNVTCVDCRSCWNQAVSHAYVARMRQYVWTVEVAKTTQCHQLLLRVWTVEAANQTVSHAYVTRMRQYRICELRWVWRKRHIRMNIARIRQCHMYWPWKLLKQHNVTCVNHKRLFICGWKCPRTRTHMPTHTHTHTHTHTLTHTHTCTHALTSSKDTMPNVYECGLVTLVKNKLVTHKESFSVMWRDAVMHVN